MKRELVIFLVLSGWLGVTSMQAQPRTDLIAGFDADMEDWSGSVTGAVLTWEAAGGASGAYLEGTGPGGDWYFLAPVTWLGDWTDFRSMKIDLAIPSRHYAENDIADILVIVGTNLNSMAWQGPTPLFTWSHYEVSLNPESFGVDQATFDGIMADVAEVRILAEYTASTETVGLDSVRVTSDPVQIYSEDLAEYFSNAEKDSTMVNGWKPVDDVTLTADFSNGRPLFGLHCDDWQDGRYFKVESPDSWAGNWSNFTELRFDMKWVSSGSEVPGEDLVTIFGANGQTLIYTTSLPRNEWIHVVIPLVPASFGVSQATFDAVIQYVSKFWIRGEYNSGDDQLYLDNIVVATAPATTRVLETSLLARFGAGTEGWFVFDNGTIGWDETGGFTGAAISCQDQGVGNARFAAPDEWSGDWSAFSTMRFMIKTVYSSRAGYSPTVTLYGFNNESMSVSPPPPYQTWSPYTIDLNPTTFSVTQDVFDAIMGNVAHVTIAGDLLDSRDQSMLDEVSLTSGEVLSPPPERNSVFDADSEGWRKGGPSGDDWTILSTAMVHSTVEGNPPGCITVDDEHSLTTWFSPVQWAGDWRGYESLSFDLKIISGTSLLAPDNLISIVSAHGNLHQAITVTPQLGIWNHYEFGLTAADFGVTQDEFETIMRDVVMVGIRAEWINGSEQEGLDNVRLSKAPEEYWVWLDGYMSPTELTDELVSGKWADADHDGATNWDEFEALTVPTDPLSRFSVLINEASPALSYMTRTGRRYQVWKSIDYTNPALWTPVGPEVDGDDTLKGWTDPETGDRAFYRVEVFRP